MPRIRIPGFWPIAIALLFAPAAHGEPKISNPPPKFRFYDVDRRETWLQATMGRLAGTSALPREKADAELANLDDVRSDEAARRQRHAGRLTRRDLIAINRRLSKIAADVGLR